MINKIINKKIFIVFTAVIGIVAIIAIYFYINENNKTPNVISTDPKNSEQEILETKQISIDFNSDISEKSKDRVSVNFEPQTDFDSIWLSNTYKIIPKNGLKNNTTYKIHVLYNKKEIDSFTFYTTVFSQEESKKYGTLQAENDLLFGKALTKIVNEYPFYTNLPIKTKNYVVYYDFEENKFAITLLTPVEGPSQRNQLIKDVLDKIKQIGAKDPIQYYINDSATTSATTAP